MRNSTYTITGVVPYLVLAIAATAGLWYMLSGNDAAAIDRACLGGCAPGSSGHWLGTDSLGRDVWLQLAGGAFTALVGGLVAASLSFIIGYILGALAADTSVRSKVIPWWLLAVWLAVGMYSAYLWQVLTSKWSLVFILVAIILFSAWIVGQSRRAKLFWSGIRPDRLLLFIAEIVSSVPALLLLLALAALAFRPGLQQLVLIYVAVRWTNFAVLSLQEVRGVLEKPFIQAARAAGTSVWAILFQHVAPNVWTPLLVKFVLAISGFILVEGTFSFLGLGLPADQPSWGRVLAQAQNVRGGWWLWVFPGLALIGSVLSLQLISRNMLRKKESLVLTS